MAKPNEIWPHLPWHGHSWEHCTISMLGCHIIKDIITTIFVQKIIAKFTLYQLFYYTSNWSMQSTAMKFQFFQCFEILITVDTNQLQQYLVFLVISIKRLSSHPYNNWLKLISIITGQDNAPKWYVNWRMFFLICSETFGYNDGNDWTVTHYLFRKPM